jgi:hypothetical protein
MLIVVLIFIEYDDVIYYIQDSVINYCNNIIF